MQALRAGVFVMLGSLAFGSAVADDLEVYFSGEGDCSCLLILDTDTIRSGISTIEQQAAAHGVDPAWLVNGDTPTEGANPPLRWNELYPGDEVVLPAGQLGDEGFFSPPPPPTIRYVDGSTSGLAYEEWINAYVAGTLTQDQLAGVRDVAPLRNADLSQLIGRKCVGVVQNSDVVINSTSTDPLNANLQGARNGVFTFTILEVLDPGSIPESQSSESLNDLRVRVEAPGSLATGSATDPYNAVTEPSSPDSSDTASAATLVPVLSINAENRLYHNNDLYIAMGEFGTTGWIGNVKRYRICDGGGGCTPGEILDADDMPAIDDGGDIRDTARSYWSGTVDGAIVGQGGAGENVPSYTERRLVTYSGTEDVPVTPVVLDPDSGEHAIDTSNALTLAPYWSASAGNLVTVRDEFNAKSYANNDGSSSWSGDWVEVNDEKGADGGNVKASGVVLEIKVDALYEISREANLNGATDAQLEFDYMHNLNELDEVYVEVSNDAGTRYTILETFTASTTQTGSRSYDLMTALGSVSANTRVRFRVGATSSGGEKFELDKVELRFKATTIRDAFDGGDGRIYNSSNGSQDWSAYGWTEIAEPTGSGPTDGPVQVSPNATYCLSPNCLRVGGTQPNNPDPGFGVFRQANLSGATTATLSFSYRRGTFGSPVPTTGALSLSISGDGGASWTFLQKYAFDAVDAAQTQQVFDISSFIATNTQIRFLTHGPVNDIVFFIDDIQIQHDGGTKFEVADTGTLSLIDWIQGRDVKDEDGDGNTDEDRPWSFASPQHSNPLIISYGNAGSTTKAEKQPIEKMVLGTSDGGLRMINAANGIEEFVFYVPSMLKDQPDLFALADSGTTLGMDLGHAYGVDGSPRVMRIDNDADGQIEPADGDRVLVYVGLRRGGNEIYALDISPDDADGLTDKTITNGITPKFMWRIRGGSGAFSALGQTWSSPQATRIAMGTATAGVRTAQSVVIFGGGYDTSQDNGFGPAPTGNAVFVVDPTNAAKILSIGGSGSGADLELPGMVYPIPGDITLMDSNGDAVTDRLYFADTGGQVWRVDLDPSLTAGNPGRTAGARLAVLSDQSATAAPADQRRFYYPPEVTRITDMERYAHVHDYDVVTITSGYAAHPLDTSVHDRVYAIRDYLVDAPISLDASTGLPTNFPQCAADGTLGACGNPLSETNLYNATDNLIQDGDDTQIAAAQVSLKNSEGWYIAFKENFSSGSGFIGEKGLSKTVVLDGILFFTTFIPPQQSCGGEVGYSRLWAVELLTGEAVFPAFDGNPNQLARTDRSRSLGSGLPAQPVPMFLPSGLRILLGSGDNLITFDPGIATPIRRSYWYEER